MQPYSKVERAKLVTGLLDRSSENCVISTHITACFVVCSDVFSIALDEDVRYHFTSCLGSADFLYVLFLRDGFHLSLCSRRGTYQR